MTQVAEVETSAIGPDAERVDREIPVARGGPAGSVRRRGEAAEHVVATGAAGGTAGGCDDLEPLPWFDWVFRSNLVLGEVVPGLRDRMSPLWWWGFGAGDPP